MFYSIYVGHLPLKATKEELKELFKAVGEVKDVVIIKKNGYEAFGYGFVRFSKPQAVVNAVKEGEWKLRGVTLHVDIASETKDAIRLAVNVKGPMSNVICRDNLVRARLKEACRIINQEIDVMKGEELLDAKWLSELMEGMMPKYGPKLPGSINPATVLTHHSLAHTLQHGLFTSDDAEYNERRKGEVEDQVKALLHNLHSEMETAISQVTEDLTLERLQMSDDMEFKTEQEKLTHILGEKLKRPKFLWSVLESHGIAVQNAESKYRTDGNADVESTPGYPKTVNTNPQNSQRQTKHYSQKLQLCTKTISTESNKSHCAKGAMKDKSDTISGAQKAKSHKFQQGACGPGGPLLRESLSPDAGQSTVSRQCWTSHNPRQHIPGGPPDSHPSGMSSNAPMEKPVSPRDDYQRKSASQSNVEDKVSSFHSHKLSTGKTSHKENGPTPRQQASKGVSPTFSMTNSSSLRNNLQQGRTANTTNQHRGGGRRRGQFLTESERLCMDVRNESQQERKVTCVIPEKYKAAIESENPGDMANSDDIWREFGKVNSQFLASGMAEELFSDTVDIHLPNMFPVHTSSTVKTTPNRTGLPPTSIKTVTVIPDVTTACEKDKGVSSFSTESGRRSSEDTTSSRAMRSPPPQSGVGRGRGGFHVALGASQQNQCVNDSGEMKSPSSAVKGGRSSTPVMGRGQALLEFLKKL